MSINIWQAPNTWIEQGGDISQTIETVTCIRESQMITLNRTRIDSISNAVLNDCLVLSNVSGSDCINTVSAVFTNCTESFTSILNQAWLTTANEINEVGQLALAGKASGGGNLIEWAYALQATPKKHGHFSFGALGGGNTSIGRL